MKKYPFLDVVVDVFYSIILYNAFVSFPGFRIESFLMLLSIFVMINYWWSARTLEVLPKHYLFDFYFITVIMFIFSQWPSYYLNITQFIYVLAIFFAVDAVYSLLSIPGHTEKADEPSLKFFFVSELLLAVFYFIASFFLTTTNVVSLVVLFIPIILVWYLEIRNGLFPIKFLYKTERTY